jgi:alkylhydroperoxidase/carboxymuconolactone decarboxylase family protein YurZ
MMNIDQEQLETQIVAANRGPFTGWWPALLEVEPRALAKVHNFLRDAEQPACISERLRHLIWVVADSVVTHLYPRGTAVHIKIAMQCGASKSEIIEALQIAMFASCRGFAHGLPIVLEEAGMSETGEAHAASLSPEQVALRNQIESSLGFWADWMGLALRHCPTTLRAIVEVGLPVETQERLGKKERELLLFAAYACPALCDREGTRRHARQALAAGATAEELISTLRLCNTISVHSMAEGVNAFGDPASARGKT